MEQPRSKRRVGGKAADEARSSSPSVLVQASSVRDGNRRFSFGCGGRGGTRSGYGKRNPHECRRGLCHKEGDGFATTRPEIGSSWACTFSTLASA
eukprot:6923604-Prorocentrum_lima.AAC.1